MLETENFKKIMNVPFSIIVASFIIIIITSNTQDSNGLSALIGGFFGLLCGLFLIALTILYEKPIPNSQNETSILMILTYLKEILLDIFPIFMMLGIISILIYYLYAYFDKIANGEVSSYYNSFLNLSTIFLVFQIGLMLDSIYKKTQNGSANLFSNDKYSILVMFGLINSLVVITIGVVLRYYSTQG